MNPKTITTFVCLSLMVQAPLGAMFSEAALLAREARQRAAQQPKPKVQRSASEVVAGLELTDSPTSPPSLAQKQSPDSMGSIDALFDHEPIPFTLFSPSPAPSALPQPVSGVVPPNVQKVPSQKGVPTGGLFSQPSASGAGPQPAGLPQQFSPDKQASGTCGKKVLSRARFFSKLFLAAVASFAGGGGLFLGLRKQGRDSLKTYFDKKVWAELPEYKKVLVRSYVQKCGGSIGLALLAGAVAIIA